ncbi:MAG: cytochrome c [Steroidobacteraceae bacterium]|nr:c-type cytochrome [Nevskiaceae bacterium]MCP5471212.1 c-type cytochrome [Nevskiaceae bacterium]
MNTLHITRRAADGAARADHGARSMRLPGVAWLALLLPLLAVFASTAGAQDHSNHTGAQLYTRFCASCHGAGGRGDGPVAPLLRVEVPDLTRLIRRPGDPFPTETVRRIVDGREVPAAHGGRRMPIWGYEFATATAGAPEAGATAATTLIDRLVGYLGTIQRHAGPAVPAVPIAPTPPSARQEDTR